VKGLRLAHKDHADYWWTRAHVHWSMYPFCLLARHRFVRTHLVYPGRTPVQLLVRCTNCHMMGGRPWRDRRLYHRRWILEKSYANGHKEET
jgi:hypothetical protein